MIGKPPLGCELSGRAVRQSKDCLSGDKRFLARRNMITSNVRDHAALFESAPKLRRGLHLFRKHQWQAAAEARSGRFAGVTDAEGRKDDAGTRGRK